MFCTSANHRPSLFLQGRSVIFAKLWLASLVLLFLGALSMSENSIAQTRTRTINPEGFVLPKRLGWKVYVVETPAPADYMDYSNRREELARFLQASALQFGDRNLTYQRIPHNSREDRSTFPLFVVMVHPKIAHEFEQNLGHQHTYSIAVTPLEKIMETPFDSRPWENLNVRPMMVKLPGSDDAWPIDHLWAELAGPAYFQINTYVGTSDIEPAKIQQSSEARYFSTRLFPLLHLTFTTFSRIRSEYKNLVGVIVKNSQEYKNVPERQRARYMQWVMNQASVKSVLEGLEDRKAFLVRQHIRASTGIDNVELEFFQSYRPIAGTVLSEIARHPNYQIRFAKKSLENLHDQVSAELATMDRSSPLRTPHLDSESLVPVLLLGGSDKRITKIMTELIVEFLKQMSMKRFPEPDQFGQDPSKPAIRIGHHFFDDIVNFLAKPAPKNIQFSFNHFNPITYYLNVADLYVILHGRISSKRNFDVLYHAIELFIREIDLVVDSKRIRFENAVKDLSQSEQDSLKAKAATLRKLIAPMNNQYGHCNVVLADFKKRPQ